MPFLQPTHFSPSPQAYSLLPFTFSRLGRERYLLTNVSGDYCVVDRDTLLSLVNKTIGTDSDAFRLFLSRQFVLTEHSSSAIDLLAARYRTRQRFLPELTSLHIFVITLRCNSACTYCQASKRERADQAFDMTASVADATVDFMFQSPSQTLKVEFQGGEALLRPDLILQVIERTMALNKTFNRQIEFVICSNLSLLTPDLLDALRCYDVYFSTSVDGPTTLHNLNRPMPDTDGYQATVRGIRLIQNKWGPDRVSALMTTSRPALACPEQIIDEYITLGFPGIFLRPLNPYGLAARCSAHLVYSVDEWLQYYKRALTYIIDLNYGGVPFREEFTALLLRRMLTCYGTGFVDLQSPTGSGIAVLAYDYDGSIYVSDEGRMLAAMGDQHFRLGHVLTTRFTDIATSDWMRDTVGRSMVECAPDCTDCACQVWCGSDPVRHYRMQGDEVGHKPTSDWCKKHKSLMHYLVTLLEDDPRSAEVLRTWASR